MKKIKKLAILVNGEHKVMGTFSKGYIEDLPYEKIVLFGGLIPIFKNGTPRWKQKLIRYWIALGLPIVSTFHAGIPDIVIHEETGFLVEENDWKSMARYMQELLLDKELYQNMSIKGKEFVRSNFSMKAHLEVIQNIIDKL